MTIAQSTGLVALLVGCCMGIQMLQYPALLILLLPSTRKIYRNYIIWTQTLFASLIMVITFLFCPIEIILYGDQNVFQTHKKLIIMANHQIYTDWWYIWIVAHHQHLGGHIKIILKDSLRKIPIFGWGMEFFEFIFLKRKWASDEIVLRTNLTRARLDHLPLWLLLFPEGTNITPDTRARSSDYAKKKDISVEPRHVLLPRSTGLHASLLELSKDKYANHLLDTTLAYSGVKASECPQHKYQAADIFLKSKGPAQVHMHATLYQLADLPPLAESAESRESFDQWLLDIFMKKDDLLDTFYKTGTFGPCKQVIRPVPRLLDWIYVGCCVLLAIYGMFLSSRIFVSAIVYRVKAYFL